MPEPRRGEIWRTDLEPSEGDEMGKVRPVLVINRDSAGRLALRIVVPLTDWKERYLTFPWMTRLDPTPQNGLSKPSSADAFQVRSLSLNRFLVKLGDLDPADVETVAESLALTIGFRPEP